ncbi:hypothetical protein PYCC9005_002246 [Savitreella phatthalungensis]
MPLDTTVDLPTLFYRQVEQTPDLIALEDAGHKYTYTQLAQEVNKLARHLRTFGVGRDSLVGVFLPRSADYVIACLAALAAGGAFLVLELAYPADLLRDVVLDARPACVVTYSAYASRFSDVSLVPLDQGLGPGADLPTDLVHDLDRLSFVAYSSGTTGKPKGIANPHRAPVLSYEARFQLSDLSIGDRVACNVFFVWEILRPLFKGATVVCVPDETSYDPVSLVELLAEHQVTETLMTPTLLAAVLTRWENLGERLPLLKTLWLNGEVVTTDLARRALAAAPQIRLLNCYSACETHEIACGDIRKMLKHLGPDEHYCPVGPPMAQIYIVDEAGRKAEVGTSGELYVGGLMLARGYLNLREITAKAFIADPFDAATGARMYKTGDRARIRENGLLEITGRVGAMIKLRGYSVVPGKVENAIVKALGVRHCVVTSHGEGLERQLVAYVVREANTSSPATGVTNGSTAVDASVAPAPFEIDASGFSPSARKALAPFLASYMIPALWVELPEIPTHEVSGKADKKRLPPPPSSKAAVTSTGDRTEVEDIAEVWAATLKISRHAITPEHSFFDLGGHSLSLADLASRISRTFGVKVPVARLAEPATLNGHLEAIRQVRDGIVADVDVLSEVRKDVVLEDDIRGSEKTAYTPLNKAKTVLLTGSTGFLGAFLLSELLESTSATVICLVRFKDPSAADSPAGIARIRKNMLDLGLWRDSIMERVEILPGTLEGKRLGLTREAFAALAQRVDVILHAGATVNLVYPYATLRAANIGGTREVLRLAALAGATVQYVSTNGVLPPAPEGWREDVSLPIEHVPTKLLDGYGQTKWVAEQLVVEAGRRAIPVAVHRVGTISGHSLTGASNPWDLLTALIVESLHLGYAPDVSGWRAEMTPVDFVAKSIVHLGSQPGQRVFHIGDPDPIDCRVVYDYLRDLGYPTSRLPFDAWVAKWQEVRGGVRGGEGAFTVDILRSGMPPVEFLQGIVVLENGTTRKYRASVVRPKVDGVLLETYLRHWFARGWLPRPPARQNALGGSAVLPRRGPLTGKVAVITGASSGIGAAVAVALAREGCHIALAARRYEALEDVKRRLTMREGKVLIRRCDVTRREDVESLISATTFELGPVDILISCAGVMFFTMMANCQTAQWEQTVDVNCKGLLNCLSSTVPGMLGRGRGHIVAISSDAGRKVFPGLGVYSASKFFVEATLQSLRLETANSGLRVTSVQPGNVATDLLGMSTDQEALKKYGEPTGARVLDPDDVAASIVYALRQPDHVAVNEILIEPREEPI